MQVPMLDLRAQYAALKEEINTAVLDVLETQQFRGGPVVASFERELAEFAGVEHAIGVGSGTDALYIALKALRLRPMDEVITTPFSFFATAGAIVNAGCIPVFADIEPDTFMLDPGAVEACITPRTRCLLPVHLYGQCARMKALREIATRRGMLIIEDAAQALGALQDGEHPGTWGMGATLSFYPTKNLGAAGEGGALLTNDDNIAEEARLLRCHGASELYKHVQVGVNSHLHAMQAAVLGVKLNHLKAWNAARRERATYYTQALTRVPGITTPPEEPGNYHVFHQYVIRVPERDLARQRLNDAGIGCGVFYPLPLHRQPCFAPFITAHTSCPEADRASREVLALPLYPELSPEQQDLVIDGLTKHMATL